MTFDPHVLAQDEFPRSDTSRVLSEFLPEWMAARTVTLPEKITLTSTGDPFQKFINAPSIILDEQGSGVKNAFKASFLDYPDFDNDSLYKGYSVRLNSSESITGIIYADGSPYYIEGTEVVNPDRAPSRKILCTARLHDFVYGFTDIAEFTNADEGVVLLPYRANILSVEVDGSVVESYEAGEAASSEDVSTLVTSVTIAEGLADDLILDEDAEETVYIARIKVKYTTEDVAYQEGADLYLRTEYSEIVVPVEGGGYTFYTSILFMFFNELDELGLVHGLYRFKNETNSQFKERVRNVGLYPEGSRKEELLNALANRLGFISTITWAASADELDLTGAYAHSIRIDKKYPHDFQWSAPFEITGDGVLADNNIVHWSLNVPAGTTNVSASFTVKYIGEDLINMYSFRPTVTLTEAVTAYLYENVIDIPRTTQFLFTTEVPFLPGSLILYHNGERKTSGVDFMEMSGSGFEILFPLSRYDSMTASYIPYGLNIPESKRLSLQQLSQIDDIAILLASIGLENTTRVNSTLHQNDEVKFTLTLANYGNVNLDSVAVAVNLLPVLTLTEGTTGCTLTKETEYEADIEVRYYTEDAISLTPLWSIDARARLLDSRGMATGELHAYAETLRSLSPIVWGDAIWDLSSWHSRRQWSSSDWTVQFSFIPHLFDPDVTAYEQDSVYATAYAPVTFGLAAVFGLSLIFGGIRYNVATDLRRREFRSGVRWGTDLLATLDLETKNSYSYGDYTAQDPTPKYQLLLHKGHYYFNDKKNYLFAQEGTASFSDVTDLYLPLNSTSTYAASGGDNIAIPNNPVLVEIKQTDDALEVPQKLRRTYFVDEDGEQTLSVTETLYGNGIDNKLYLAYTDTLDLVLVPGLDYILVGNQVELTTETIVPPASAFTVTYALSGGYMVDWNFGDESHIVTNESAPYITVKYEKSSSVSHTSQEFVNPMYQPHSRGFIYYTDGYYQVGSVDVWASPQNLAAGSNQLVTVTAEVLDTYGAPIPDAIVSFIASTGQEEAGSTDRFGRATFMVAATDDPQIIKVEVVVTVFDETLQVVTTRNSIVYIDCFLGTAGGLTGPFYAPEGDIASEDIESGKYEYYSDTGIPYEPDPDNYI